MEDSRRCTARSGRSGERCKKAAILGGNVCATHGGSAPQVRRSAEARLAELVDPALTTLHTIITEGIKLDAIPSAVRASLGVLDRTGLGPTRKHEVEMKDPDQVLAEILGISPDNLPD